MTFQQSFGKFRRTTQGRLLRRFWPKTLKAQLLFYGTLSVLITGAVVGWLDFRTADTDARREVQEKMLEVSTVLISALEHVDPQQGQAILDAFQRDYGADEGSEVLLVDLQGQVIAASRRASIGKPVEEVTGHPEPELWEVLAGRLPQAQEETTYRGIRVFDLTLPLHGDPTDPARVTGVLRYAEPYTAYIELLQQTLLRFFLSEFLLVVLLIVPFWLFLERRILRPVRRIVAADRALAHGRREGFTIPESAIPNDEIGEIARVRAEMLAQLEAAQAEEQTALLDLSQRLLAAKDEHTVVECAVEVAASALGTDFSVLVLADAAGRLLTRAVRGWPAEFAGTLELGRGAASQTGLTIQQGQSIAVEDYAQETTFSVPAVVFERGIVSGLSAPMILEGRVVGAILVHSRTRRRFGDDEIRRLSLIANQTAVALDKVRLLMAERRRAEELTILYTITTIGVETTAVDTLIKRAIALIGDTVYPADYFGIGLIDEAAGVLHVHRLIRGGREERLTLPLGQGIAGQVIAKGQPRRIPDVRREPAYFPMNPSTRSELCVPLKVGQRVMGLINIESRRLDAFSEADERLMTAFAGQVATAIEKVRLFQSEQRRAQEVETLRQAGAAVVTTLHQDEAIELILQQLARVVPYDSASVQLLVVGAGASADYLEIIGGRGWQNPAAVVGLRFPVPGDNPNAVVIQQRQPHILEDAPAHYAAFRDAPHNRIQSWLGVPLIVRERVIGMLAVDSAQLRFFNADHARLVAAFADQVAIAMENVRLFETERRGREAVVALLEITQVAGSSLELKEVLKHIAQRTAEACRANRCTIFLLDAAGEYLQPVMSQFADGHADPGQWHAFKSTTADRLDVVPLFREAIRERRPALLNDAMRTDLVPLKWTQPFGIQKLLAVPLVSQDRAIGLMALDHTEVSREFTPDQINLALTIGGQATSAITNARLYVKAEKRADQLRVLREAGQTLASNLHAEVILQTLVETAQRLANARYAALAVLGVDGQLTQFHTSGLTEVEREQIGAPPRGRGLLGALLREGVPLRLTDLTRDPRAAGFPPHHPPMKTFMGVPMVARGKVLGSLYLTEKMDGQSFTQEDEDLVVGLAADAAIAIENARLFGEVQQLSITDELTRIHNRRHFFELAAREFERTRRYGRAVAAIMLDIDRFKRVNDTYGHAVGDQVLRAVAARCLKKLRDIDVLGRYGGEEFAVLLPETDLDGARNVAERMRECVAGTPIDTRSGPVTVTISLGITVCTEDCPDLPTLIDRADLAMYAAKAAGRNRVYGA